MISLQNINVLITGGSRGIGKACVEIFSEEVWEMSKK